MRVHPALSGLAVLGLLASAPLAFGMAARSFKYGNFSHPLTVHRAVDGVAVLSGNSSYVKTTVPDGAAWATVVVFPCSGQVDSFVKATAANEPPPTSGFAVQHLWPDELKGGAVSNPNSLAPCLATRLISQRKAAAAARRKEPDQMPESALRLTLPLRPHLDMAPCPLPRPALIRSTASTSGTR